MKDHETVQKLIELSAQGLSYSRISQQLGVAPSTLVDWSRKHQHLIQNLSQINWEEFMEASIVRAWLFKRRS